MNLLVDVPGEAGKSSTITASAASRTGVHDSECRAFLDTNMKRTPLNSVADFLNTILYKLQLVITSTQLQPCPIYLSLGSELVVMLYPDGNKYSSFFKSVF